MDAALRERLKAVPVLGAALKTNGRLIGIETRAVSDGSVASVIFNTNSTTGTPSNVNYKSDITSTSTVPTATLAEICRVHGIERLDFLKVDTDGYEVEVFGGAGSVIEHFAPIIFTEFCPTALDRLHSAQQFFDMLVEMKCAPFYVFAHSGEYLGVADTLDEILRLKADDYYVDLVCTPQGGPYVAALDAAFGRR